MGKESPPAIPGTEAVLTENERKPGHSRSRSGIHRRVSEGGALHISRVTLPRYDFVYATPEAALSDGLQIRRTRQLTVEYPFPIPEGAEFVLDFSTEGIGIGLTLLFKMKLMESTLCELEWWERRQTDGASLDIWIDALRHHLGQVKHADQGDLSPSEHLDLLQLCRRLMSKNPFTAMAAEWTWGQERVLDQCGAVLQQLGFFVDKVDKETRISGFLQAAIARYPDLRKQLTTHEARNVARSTFVPSAQINQAIELARHRKEVAEMRGDMREVYVARLEIEELQWGLGR